MKQLTILLVAIACTSLNVSAAPETPVEIIPLAPPLDHEDAELSGLTWCGDKLILQPQYPERFSEDGNSYFYYLHKQQVLDYLDGDDKSPLIAQTILVNEKDLRKAVSIFDGFEALACQGGSVWLSIEALTYLGKYQSFIVPGSISFEGQASITIYQDKLVHLSSLSKMKNIGDEAIFLDDDSVIAIHEVNDPRAVALPKARRYQASAGALRDIDFPALPYRITDATKLDNDNRFWAINYKYSGDRFSRKAEDPLSEKFGIGDSHKKYHNIERLLEFQLDDEGISLTQRAPIQLKMEAIEGRNWEGLARLDKRGFLVVSDKHPRTLLGFIPVKR